MTHLTLIKHSRCLTCILIKYIPFIVNSTESVFSEGCHIKTLRFLICNKLWRRIPPWRCEHGCGHWGVTGVPSSTFQISFYTSGFSRCVTFWTMEFTLIQIIKWRIRLLLVYDPCNIQIQIHSLRVSLFTFYLHVWGPEFPQSHFSTICFSLNPEKTSPIWTSIKKENREQFQLLK